MKRCILLIEDEPAIAETIVYALQSDGFATHWVTLGGEGLTHLQTNSVDLVILDVGLPDQNGFEVLKAIQNISKVPVIFLTARSDEIDRVVGLEIGADDYIVKPFSPRELVARVKAVLRRKESGVQKTETTQVSRFHVDTEKCQIFYFGTKLDLSHYEYRILQALIQQPGRVFSREQLLHVVSDDPFASQDRTIDSHIKNIRNLLREIRSDVDSIQTHRGMGYSLKETF